jgi:hypothetical protein
LRVWQVSLTSCVCARAERGVAFNLRPNFWRRQNNWLGKLVWHFSRRAQLLHAASTQLSKVWLRGTTYALDGTQCKMISRVLLLCGGSDWPARPRVHMSIDLHENLKSLLSRGCRATGLRQANTPKAMCTHCEGMKFMKLTTIHVIL